MLNFTGRFLYVSNPSIRLDVSERIVFANLTSSRADKRTNPVVYHRSYFFDVQFVGDAFEAAKALKGGEKIDVIRGMHTNEKDEHSGRYYSKYVVFEFELSSTPEEQTV